MASMAYETMLMHASMCQPMTSGLALLAHWSVSQKLKCVSLVQLRRSVCAFDGCWFCSYFTKCCITDSIITWGWSRTFSKWRASTTLRGHKTDPHETSWVVWEVGLGSVVSSFCEVLANTGCRWIFKHHIWWWLFWLFSCDMFQFQLSLIKPIDLLLATGRLLPVRCRGCFGLCSFVCKLTQTIEKKYFDEFFQMGWARSKKKMLDFGGNLLILFVHFFIIRDFFTIHYFFYCKRNESIGILQVNFVL